MTCLCDLDTGFAHISIFFNRKGPRFEGEKQLFYRRVLLLLALTMEIYIPGVSINIVLNFHILAGELVAGELVCKVLLSIKITRFKNFKILR
jgi:hypothetical protein